LLTAHDLIDSCQYAPSKIYFHKITERGWMKKIAVRFSVTNSKNLLHFLYFSYLCSILSTNQSILF
jgi:hypothetical protein